MTDKNVVGGDELASFVLETDLITVDIILTSLNLCPNKIRPVRRAIESVVMQNVELYVEASNSDLKD